MVCGEQVGVLVVRNTFIELKTADEIPARQRCYTCPAINLSDSSEEDSDSQLGGSRMTRLTAFGAPPAELRCHQGGSEFGEGSQGKRRSNRGWRGLPSRKKKELVKLGIDSAIWNLATAEPDAPGCLKELFPYVVRQQELKLRLAAGGVEAETWV